VIVIAGDRVFRSLSSAAVQKLLRRELKAGIELRLLDSAWRWFDVLADVGAIAPSFGNHLSPTKQTVITLVNGRSNRSADAPLYEPRSLSSRTREEVFTELIAVLPVG
jgi:hypothetical protein